MSQIKHSLSNSLIQRSTRPELTTASSLNDIAQLEIDMDEELEENRDQEMNNQRKSKLTDKLEYCKNILVNHVNQFFNLKKQSINNIAGQSVLLPSYEVFIFKNILSGQFDVLNSK